MSRPADATDVALGFRLFLGREPEHNAVLADQLGGDVATVCAAILGSQEFGGEVAGPLIAGGALVGRFPVPPSAEVRNWVLERLPLHRSRTRPRVEAAERWSELLAAVADDPAFRLLQPPPVAELLARLAPALAARETEVDVAPPWRDASPTLDALLSRIGADSLRLIGDGWLELTQRGGWLDLKLPAETAAAGLVLVEGELDSAFGSAGVRLSVRYGEGGVETEALVSDALGGFGAVLPAASLISGLRLRFDRPPGAVRIRRLSARPLDIEGLRARAEAAGVGTSGLLAGVLEAAAAAWDRLDLGVVATGLSRALSRPTSPEPYDRWIAQNEGGDAAVPRRVSELPRRPTVTVLVPVYNAPEPWLTDAIWSVRNQSYPEWELLLVDDGSTEPVVRTRLAALAEGEPRIRVIHRDTNGGIAAASQTGLDAAAGEWLALLDQDDRLAEHALLSMVEAMLATPEARLAYSDEDKLDEAGRRYMPYFKPRFSPDLLRSQNYFNHLTLHHVETARAAGGFRPGFEGSQDHDLNLRVVERLSPAQIVHVPKVLYHWRALASSTAGDNAVKSDALQTGRRALSEHLERTGLAGSVEITPPHYYRIRWALPRPAPHVTLIVPTRDRVELLERCVRSVLDNSTYGRFDVLIVDNGSVEPETADAVVRLSADERVSVLAHPGPFNFSAIINAGIRAARGEIVGLLNNDLEVITPDWLEEMVGWAAQGRIGCVGAKLYYPDDTLQHGGVVLGIGGVAGHPHKREPRTGTGYMSRLLVAHNVSAVTGACLLVRRDVFDAVGGFDETLAVAFNDVDFCLKVREAGYLNVFTPFAELYHLESASRGLEDTAEKVARFNAEADLMRRRWGEALLDDPYYSPNLTLERENFGLRGV